MNQIIATQGFPTIKFRDNLVSCVSRNLTSSFSADLINCNLSKGLYKVIWEYYWCGRNYNISKDYCWTGYNLIVMCDGKPIHIIVSGPGCANNCRGCVNNEGCSNSVFESLVYVPSDNTNIVVKASTHDAEDYSPLYTGSCACATVYLTRLI